MDARRVEGRWNERQAMRGPQIAAFALSFALLANGTFAIAGTTGSITGTVVAASGGGPLAGALISAVSPSQVAGPVTTDASGRFSLLSLAPDTYTIAVSKPDFVPFRNGRRDGARRPGPEFSIRPGRRASRPSQP